MTCSEKQFYCQILLISKFSLRTSVTEENTSYPAVCRNDFPSKGQGLDIRRTFSKYPCKSDVRLEESQIKGVKKGRDQL